MKAIEAFGHAFSAICGQDPAHTWACGGVTLPCCQRCTGLYVGAVLAALVHLGFKPRLTGRFLEVHGAFLLLMVPFGFHWISQGPAGRAVTGVLFGFGLVTFLKLPLSQCPALRWTAQWPQGETATSSGWYFTAAGLAAFGVPLLGALGGELAAWGLSGAALLGVLVLSLLVLANAGLGLAGAARLLRRLGRRSIRA